MAQIETVESQRFAAEGPEYFPIKDANEAITALVADILAVRKNGTIRIFCGEAHPVVYNSPLFLEAVRHVKRTQEARICVLAGPIIVVEENGHNGLLQLKKEGIIELYYRPSRDLISHFRVVETNQGYRLHLEFPHTSLPPINERLTANPAQFSEAEVNRRAIPMIQVFDGLIRYLQTRFPEEEIKSPLVATESGLRQIAKEASARQISFESASRSTLLELPSGRQVLRPTSI